MTARNAVIYTRASHASDGRSVESQEVECRAWCERENIPVRKVFTDDGISASRFGKYRDQWERLKAELRKGDVLVVWESSRTSRDLTEFVRLRDLCESLNVPLAYNGRLLDFTKGDDRFIGSLDAILSEYESARLQSRVLRGKRAAAAAGRPNGRVAWGYRVVGRGVWEIDPVEGPRVREALRRILDGEGTTTVYKWLRRTGYAPAELATFKQSMMRPTYAALRQHQGKVIGNGTWPALITPEEHRRVCQLVRRNAMAEPPGRGPEPKYLLTGIARCGVCDLKIVRKARKGAPPRYGCPDGHVTRSMALIDALVQRVAVKHMNTFPPEEMADDGALAELDELHAELEEWRVLADKREVSPASFARAEAPLLARIAELEQRAMPVTPGVGFNFTLEQFLTLDLETRRGLMRSFRIVLNPSGGRKTLEPQDVQMTLVER